MSSRERAARRRAQWSARVVELGEPKGRLYASLTPEERLCALGVLNERAWVAAGNAMPPALPRNQWPGAVFEIRRRG